MTYTVLNAQATESAPADTRLVYRCCGLTLFQAPQSMYHLWRWHGATCEAAWAEVAALGASPPDGQRDVADVSTEGVMTVQESPRNAPGTGQEARTTHNTTTDTRQATSPVSEGKDRVSQQTGWRRTIERYLIDSDALAMGGKVPKMFIEGCLGAYLDQACPDEMGETLAAQVMDWVAAQ